MKILFYLNLLWALLALGCDSEVDGRTAVMSKNYIRNYLEADSIIYPGIYANNEDFPYSISIHFEFTGEMINTYDKERFLYYSTQFGDTAYNQKQDFMSSPNTIANRWLSVTLTCNQDYDAAHPAGASLNDIVRLNFRSPYTYIKSGYQENLFWRRKLISEMSAEDLLLIENNIINLEFVSPPDTLAMRQFTFTWQAENKTIKSVFNKMQDKI